MSPPYLSVVHWLLRVLGRAGLTEEKQRLGGRDDRASIGVEATEEYFPWHWEQQFAAVASDTVAYEAWPSLGRVYA